MALRINYNLAASVAQRSLATSQDAYSRQAERLSTGRSEATTRLLLQLEVSDAEIAARRARWQAPAARYPRGVLAKFQKLASSASRGAVLDDF